MNGPGEGTQQGLGALLPEIVSPPPGPASRAMAERLRAVESRNVTFVDDGWPVFWSDARGANVVDADGNVYVDLTSAFGVALLGHGSAALERTLAARGLVHGMGDIHPPTAKLELLERLAAIAPWPETKVILGSSGSEAVEAALKTAALASGRPGVLAFEGGYHGLTVGSLAVTERPHFRERFGPRLYGGVAFAPWPAGAPSSPAAVLERVARLLDEGAPNGDPIGTIVVEPVQARGGARVPPEGFMPALSEIADERGILVVADEIFTGLGRCGALFASSRVGLRPDVICVGKVLGAGLPLSACLAPAAVMDAWPRSSGEAIHTSTFLGHPLACAAAVATLDDLERCDVPARAEVLGRELRDALERRAGRAARVSEIRGLGLLIGVAFADPASGEPIPGAGARVARRLLADGLIALPAGDLGEVLELAPPVTITAEQIGYAVARIGAAIEEAG